MARSLGAFALIVALALMPGAGRGQPAMEPPAMEPPATDGPPAGVNPWRDYPTREVERPVLPPAKGMITSLDLRSVSASRALDQDGNAKDTHGPFNLLTLMVQIAYGLTDRVELSAGFPYITGEIGETEGGAIGSLFAAARVGLLPAGGPANIVAGLGASYPLGSADYHYELLGKNLVLQNFRISDPSYDLYPELEGRYRVGAVSLRLSLTGIITNEGEVNFSNIYGDNKQVTADPGDGYAAETGCYWQATDHWVPGLFLRYTDVSETRIDGKGLHDAMRRYELQPRIMWQQSQSVEAMIGTGFVLAGKNTPLGYPVIIQINARF